MKQEAEQVRSTTQIVASSNYMPEETNKAERSTISVDMQLSGDQKTCSKSKSGSSTVSQGSLEDCGSVKASILVHN